MGHSASLQQKASSSPFPIQVHAQWQLKTQCLLVLSSSAPTISGRQAQKRVSDGNPTLQWFTSHVSANWKPIPQGTWLTVMGVLQWGFRDQKLRDFRGRRSQPSIHHRSSLWVISVTQEESHAQILGEKKAETGNASSALRWHSLKYSCKGPLPGTAVREG